MSKESIGSFQERAEKQFLAEGEMKSVFSMLGDTIAKDQGYEDLRGMDAIYRYLIDKYHWLPHQVRSLSVEDLGLLFDGYKKRTPMKLNNACQKNGKIRPGHPKDGPAKKEGEKQKAGDRGSGKVPVPSMIRI